jgi:acyl CoA:acetate/3-ketoacid CoA transferase
MEFRPEVSPTLKEMDPSIFRPEAMGLAALIAAKARPTRSQRLSRFLPKAVP